jgi:hypothetical protein
LVVVPLGCCPNETEGASNKVVVASMTALVIDFIGRLLDF